MASFDRRRAVLNCVLFIGVFFSFCILPAGAITIFYSFIVGDSSVPVDEDGFIVYEQEWADDVAAGLNTTEVSIDDIYQLPGNPDKLAVNLTVRTKPTNGILEVLELNFIPYQNVICLTYNRTQQTFQYDPLMEDLLLACYGGFYIIPNDPVDVNIVKTYIDTYTSYTASVQGNVVTIDINNVQAILTYNDEGILTSEDLKINGQLEKTLRLVGEEGNVSFGFIFLLFLPLGTLGLIIKIRRKIILKISP